MINETVRVGLLKGVGEYMNFVTVSETAGEFGDVPAVSEVAIVIMHNVCDANRRDAEAEPAVFG